ncbi:MAG TPA: LytTR family DNA-binding domain-containing protein [Methylomirabilota bacterium]|nr:LytTR family DNA-binding domain-containing protein [Methylomirabilota bacterium]
MKIRVVFADDEPLARDRLRRLLAQEPDVEIVAECADGVSAVAALREHSPDLALLDVQMPELDGFGVVASLEAARRPEIIFVTAHDQFALRAFEVHAVDYLLKPFDTERFQAALRRARERIRQKKSGDLNDRLSSLLNEVRSEARSADRLAIKSGGRVLFLKIDDIDWIEAADNYVNLHLGPESHLHRETMSSLESRLPAGRFMRISRSSIVNVDRIKELQPLFHGEYAVILRNGTRLTLSRGYRDNLQQLLGQES